MTRIVTSDEFVTLILAALKLRYRNVALLDADLDHGLQEAYFDLSLAQHGLNVTSNFTFFPDPLHGNSAKLRRAILWARDRGFLEASQDRQGTKYQVTMSDQLARRFLAEPATGIEFLDRVAAHCFPTLQNAEAAV